MKESLTSALSWAGWGPGRVWVRILALELALEIKRNSACRDSDQNASLSHCQPGSRSLQPRTVTACGFSSSLHQAEDMLILLA